MGELSTPTLLQFADLFSVNKMVEPEGWFLFSDISEQIVGSSWVRVFRLSTEGLWSGTVLQLRIHWLIIDQAIWRTAFLPHLLIVAKLAISIGMANSF